MDTLNPNNPEHAVAWLTSAMEEYAVALKALGGCNRPGCVTLMQGRGADSRCTCHEDPHMMLKYASATQRFAQRVHEEAENIERVLAENTAYRNNVANPKLTR
jgi:hypothetical protein